MNPSETRLYEELTAATGAIPIESRDPEAERCLRFLLDGEGDLDDLLGCYGDEDETADEEHGIRSVDLAVSLGIPFHDVQRGIYVLPRSLVQRIERTYEEVSRAGFLTHQDFEERLYQWLSESVQ